MAAQLARYRGAAVSLLSWRFAARVLPEQAATLTGYVAAGAGTALATAAIGALLAQVRVENAAMLYLLVVLPTAVQFGRGPAVFASVAAFLSFNWFFVQPLHTFTVADPVEWLALLVFLAVAVVTSQLAAAQRQRAQEAHQREQEARALYDLAHLLATGTTPDGGLGAVVEYLRRVLDLEGCAVLEAADPQHGGRVVVRAQSGAEDAGARREWLAAPAPLVPEELSLPADSASPAPPRRWVRIRPSRPPARPSGGAPAQSARTAAPAAQWVSYTPLRAGTQTVGMLRLVARSEPEWSPSLERLFIMACDQIGQAMERARLRQEATEAEVLRRTDEVRQAVLASVSHDLRTPLASIRASAENLHQPVVRLSDEERAAFADAILQDVDYLHGLVENLLDLSRIEAGKLVPQRDWYPLDSLVDDVIGRLERLTAQHSVRVNVPDDLPPVPLDYVQIGQVLANLVENAVRYTPPGTTITIDACQQGEWVALSVTDDGPGIPPGALPHVFEKFYRVSGGDRAAIPGTGLGLSVAKGLVEAHGGSIHAKSPVPGQSRGTVFTVRLPVLPPARAVPSGDPTRADAVPVASAGRGDAA